MIAESLLNLEACRPYVRAVLMGAGIKYPDLDDLTQEVMIRALRGQYEGRSKPTTYLYHITKNVATDYRRAVKRRPVCVDLDYIADICSDKKPESSVRDLKLNVLADHELELLQLRYVEQLKTSEIAERLDTSNGAVKSKLHRIMRRLRRGT